MASKILIVDDDADTVKFLSLFVSRLGYEPLQAVSGLQALEIAHQHLPDLIILDLMMPNVDGYEVARSLKRHPDTALIPILMLSAKSLAQDKVAGYESGVDLYLTKPILPVDLQANIKAVLSRRRSQDEQRGKRAYVVGLMAAKGGLGVSTVALNLGVAYRQKHQEKIAVAEMRPGQGIWAEQLGYGTVESLCKLLSLSPADITEERIELELQKATFGISMLLASQKASTEEFSGAISQYQSVIKGLARLVDVAFLDTGTTFHPALGVFFDLSDEMVVITESQPVTLKRTLPLLGALRKEGFGSAKALTLITVNRVRSEMSLTVSQIEQILGQNVILGVPAAPELAYLADSRQQPLYLAQPGGTLSVQFDNLAEHVSKHVKQKLSVG